jgi:hypothetical protein
VPCSPLELSPPTATALPPELRGSYRAADDPGVRYRLFAHFLYQLAADSPPEVRRLRWADGELRLCDLRAPRTYRVVRSSANELLLQERGGEPWQLRREAGEVADAAGELATLGDPARYSAYRIPGAREELLTRLVGEQELRRRLGEQTAGVLAESRLASPDTADLVAEMNQADVENRRFLLRLVAEAGWIDRRRFGARAVDGAVLLVLHAGHVPLLRAVLVPAEAEWRRGGLSALQLASLVDRLRLLTGQPLHFGSQALVDPDGERVYPVPRELDHLEEARRGLGLSSFAELLDEERSQGASPRLLVVE